MVKTSQILKDTIFTKYIHIRNGQKGTVSRKRKVQSDIKTSDERKFNICGVEKYWKRSQNLISGF